MKKSTKFTNKSIDRIGLPKDYKRAFSEYIKNGFEAGASKIKISFKGNSLGNIEEFSIEDNGSGIAFEMLDTYFGNLLDSHKEKNKHSSEIRGGSGRGRLSFHIFAGRAMWETTYKKGKEFFRYKIKIDGGSRNEYDDGTSDQTPYPEKSNQSTTGTMVRFENIKNLTIADLESEDLHKYLRMQYSWFLFLNKDKDYQILINGKKIDYELAIYDTNTVTEKIEDSNFDITYIQWNEKIGENALYHFLKEYSLQGEKYRENTGFNKIGGGAYGFYHSIYIKSEYFSNFIYEEKISPESEKLGLKNQTNKTFKELKKFLDEFLKEKRDNFYRIGASKKIEEFEKKETLPNFADNKYDQARKQDFEAVFKEIYLIEPVVFHKLSREQEKSLLGMLNLLLDSNERENILIIVDGLVKDLDPERRERLANILKKTKFNKVVDTIHLIEDRVKAIETLKTLIFDLKKFTNERDQIQKIIEDNYWIFGEQFHITSADENFETMLNNYLAFLDGYPSIQDKQKFRLTDNKKKKRPDIFICRQRPIPAPNSNDHNLEENILVELKRPAVNIGIEQYRQIEDYFNYILSKDEFNSEERKWKFYIVGNIVEPEVAAMYERVRDKGKKFLVNVVKNYEIYALSWDNLFQDFKMKNQYLLEKLSFDKTAIQEELKLKGINLSYDSSRNLAKTVSKALS